MHIYRCELTLLEATFFSSREVSNTYYTEPLLGNIALAYAFELCRSDYFNGGAIHYKAHLSELNARGVYVTPGTFRGRPRFTMRQFNAQADAYWSAFANNVIVTRPDDAWTERRGAVWYVVRPGERDQKVGLENRPQHGRLRLLAIGNRAVCYVLSREPLDLPRYIRLGKFMSKARVQATAIRAGEVELVGALIPALLNPADLPESVQLGPFDLVSVPPAPLIRNAVLSGRFYRMPGNGELLPVGMRFNVELLP